MTEPMRLVVVGLLYFSLGWYIGVRAHKRRVRRSYEAHLRAAARRRGMDA